MNGVLMLLFLTLDKYLFCTKMPKFGNQKNRYVQHNAGYEKYYRLIASWTWVIIMNLQILNRNIHKKQLMYILKH